MRTSPETTMLTIASQNLLLDYTRTRKGLILSQDQRIGSIAATLAHFPAQFDLVGVQEAHKSATQHNGEVLSEALGFWPGYWFNHNQKQSPESPRGRPHEYIGLLGAAIDHAEVIELGDNRRAVCTSIADVAFMTVHLRSGSDGRKKRRDQARAVTQALEPFENAVVLGDFNEPPIRYYAMARDELSKAGFQSVFTTVDKPHPVTCPVESYRDASAAGRGWQGRFVRRGWSIDDIQVRGPRVDVLGAGVLQRVVAHNAAARIPTGIPLEGSDHDGVWAQLEIL